MGAKLVRCNCFDSGDPVAADEAPTPSEKKWEELYQPKGAGVDISKATTDELFALYDADQDGSLSKTELKRMLKDQIRSSKRVHKKILEERKAELKKLQPDASKMPFGLVEGQAGIE